jgi:hypothetical protein
MYSVSIGENAVDIKETRGPVIISENDMSGYVDRSTSNGEAIRLNDEGSQGEIWVIANRFHDGLSGIQPQNSHSTGIYILGNLFYNLTGRAIGDDAGLVFNNTIYNTPIGIASASEFRNNIIVNATNTAISKNVSGCSYNVVSGGTVQASCSNTLTTNPAFVNASGLDFHLQSGSPARNSGTTATPYQTFQSRYGRSISLDPDRVVRPTDGTWDRGAYEFGTGGGGGGGTVPAPIAPSNLRIVQ